MSRRLAILPAMLACFVLCAGCGVSTSQVWLAETRVEAIALEEPEFRESREAGMLVLTAEHDVQTTITPSERLYLVHKQTYSTWDWDRAGLVFFTIVGAVASIGLYLLFALYVYPDEDETN